MYRLVQRALVAVTLVASPLCADLPKLTEATPELLVAYAKERVGQHKSEALRDELRGALLPLARDGDAAKLLSRASQPAVALALAQYRVLSGHAANGTSFTAAVDEVAAGDRGVEFLAWFFGDLATLEEIFTTGAPPADAPGFLRGLLRIWQSDPAMTTGLQRRIAVATALEHATPMIPWSEWNDPAAKPIDPLARYEFYRDLWSSRALFACFDELLTWEMRRVVDCPLYDEDIRWFHSNLPQTLKEGSPLLRSQQEIGNAAHLVPYRAESPTNGKSVQLGKPFYDDKRLTPAVMLEYGGVCGAVAKFGSFAARAFGVPAQPLGQEGHCALCWKHQPTDWRTGNCGSDDDWVVSNLHQLWGSWSTRGAVIPLLQSLHAHPSFLATERARLLARCDDREFKKRFARELEIAERCPLNVFLWQALAEQLAAQDDAKPEDIRRFSSALMRALSSAPQLALDALGVVERSKAFAAFGPKERVRYADDLIESFARSIDDPKTFDGGEAGLKAASHELLGRGVWIVSGKTSSLGEWPYLSHRAILDGSQPQWMEWWTSAEKGDRQRVVDYLLDAAGLGPRRPEVAEEALPRLLALAERDESLRPRVQRAADAIAESYTKSGKVMEAVRVYRAMILAAERMGHRPWAKSYSERAIALREKK